MNCVNKILIVAILVCQHWGVDACREGVEEGDQHPSSPHYFDSAVGEHCCRDSMDYPILFELAWYFPFSLRAVAVRF